MKKKDLSQVVMKKVAGVERIRTSAWIRNFIIVLGCFCFSILIVLVLIVKDLLEKRAFDVFELFSQDSEIISEFWREVVLSFVDELPQNLLFITVVLCVLLLIIVFITRLKRSIIRIKVRELEKYM